MSSLARQLASIASLDASRLASSAKQSSTQPSYIFSPKEAAQHDLQTIHSLGQNGFEQLLQLDSSLGPYEDELFGEAARGLDRMVLPRDENERLGGLLDKLLMRLGKHVPTRAFAKVIEWLVRRFRIHEMNVDGVLACFLPYHDTPQFARILMILKIEKNTPLSTLLQPPKTSQLSLTRHHLLQSLHKDKSHILLRLVSSLLSRAIESDAIHRTLISFHTATLVGYVEHGSGAKARLGDGELTALIPGVIEGLKGNEDCLSATFIILLVISRKTSLSPQATHALVSSALTSATSSKKSSSLPEKLLAQLVSTVLSLIQSQNEVEEVGSDIIELLVKVENAGSLMASASSKFELSKALRPVLKSLVSSRSNPSVSPVLLSYITSPLAPPPAHLVSFLTRQLLTAFPVDTETDPKIQILSSIKERYDSIWEKESQRVLGEVQAEGDESKQKSLLEVVGAVSGAATASAVAEGDLLLSLASSDAASRLFGVRSMIDKMHGTAEALEDGMDVDGSAHPASPEEIVSSNTLLLLLSDSYAPVIEALYSSPSILFSILTPTEILTSLSSTISHPSTSKSIAKKHLQFLAGPFVTRYPERANEVVTSAFWGSLLVSKPRQLASAAAWEVLSAGEGLNNGQGLLDGIASDVLESLKDVKDDSPEKHKSQATANHLIADKIAANVIDSSSFTAHLDFLLSQLSTPDSHARILAHLVLTSLLKSASGAQHVEIAVKVVESLRSIEGALQGLDIVETEQLESVVLKPNSVKTTQRVRGSLLLALQTIKAPSDVSIAWLEPSSMTAPASRFAHLAYAIYSIVNSSLAPSNLSNPLLRALFSALRDDALLFLASIYTASPSHPEAFPVELQKAALRHAEAFLKAHLNVGQGKDVVDFQTVVPSLLVALGSVERENREAALSCLKLVAEVLGSQSGVPYALDRIYGSGSDQVQVLKPSELRRYIEILIGDEASLAIDPLHLSVLHANELSIVKGEGKKESGFKRSVLSYLLSHVTAWSSPSARITLLRAARPIRAANRLQTLYPLIAEIIAVAPAYSPESKSILDLLFDSFDKSSLSVIAESPEIWEAFKKSLTVDAATPSGRTARQAALDQLQSVFFQVLPENEKVDLVELLVRSITDESSSEVGDIKACLRVMGLSSAITVHVLSRLRPAEDVTRAAKRSKQDSETQAKALLAFHRGLVVILEARSMDALEGDAMLLAALLDILSSLLDSRTRSGANVDYAEQLLLTALCAVSSRVECLPATSQIDVNTVVKVISDCRNPQTFQQGLLLVSSLARLVPDLVLQNLLPIFISVGANAVQRDDAYTFRVVEKTIESIVPVMVEQHRKDSSDRFSLWKKSQDFLEVFTGMAPHLPAHRKTRLFSHLVETLQATDFLGPVLLLLLDKLTPKSSKKTVDPSVLFSLPLSVFECVTGEARFQALNDLSDEASRLLAKITGSSDAEPFLATADNADAFKIDRRRILAILSFVQLSCSAKSIRDALAASETAGEGLKNLVGRLLRLSSLVSEDILSEGFEDIKLAVQVALEASTNLQSVADFASAIAPLLTGESLKMQLGAFALLHNRVPNMKSEARQTVSSTMITAVTSSIAILKSDATESECLHVIRAVQTIASTANAKEDASLGQLVDVLIKRGQQQSTSDKLLTGIFSLLGVLNRRLGPRLIPVIKPFVAFAVEVVKKGIKNIEKVSFREILFPAVLASLGGLVTSVPTFIGTQLVDFLSTIFNGTLLEAERTYGPVQALLRVIAKELPAKNAFPAVFSLWEKVDKTSAVPIASFFDLLRRVLRNANREAVSAQLKGTFAFFLSAFDLRWTLRSNLTIEEIYSVEAKSISAFMEVVVKLSEATFRPLFVRVYDWAAVELVDEASSETEAHLIARRTMLFAVMEGLLERFKSIMTPYTAIVLDHAQELLQSYVDGTTVDIGLWSQIMLTFDKSFEYDEGAFWTDEHLTKLLPSLIAQTPILPSLGGDAPGALGATLASLSAATASPSILKSLNHTLLLHTRSSSAAVRTYALDAASAIWSRSGDDMLEYVPTTVSDFVAECVEDEDETVEKAARAFIVVLEKHVGPLDAFFSGDA